MSEKNFEKEPDWESMVEQENRRRFEVALSQSHLMGDLFRADLVRAVVEIAHKGDLGQGPDHFAYAEGNLHSTVIDSILREKEEKGEEIIQEWKDLKETIERLGHVDAKFKKVESEYGRPAKHNLVLEVPDSEMDRLSKKGEEVKQQFSFETPFEYPEE